jgi:TP53 regulating kinase-like protein
MLNMELWKQGAEAKIYKTNFYGRPCIVKERFSKSYRHPSLDKSLTAHRVKSEVRAMLRCRVNGKVLFLAHLSTGAWVLTHDFMKTYGTLYICDMWRQCHCWTEP